MAKNIYCATIITSTLEGIDIGTVWRIFLSTTLQENGIDHM